LLGSLSWGQATSSKSALTAQKALAPTNATPNATTPYQSQQVETSIIEPDVPVITIDGLCDSPPADKAVTSDCKTVITRAQFEKVTDAVQPNMSPRAQREFATSYANFLVKARKAEQMGLDKGVNFEEQMRIARIEVLSRALNKAIQKEASQIPDKDIEDYYRNNAASFEQAEMERIYVPKTQVPTPSDKALSGADEQKRLQTAAQLMKDVADKLHTSAIAGADFNQLQIDAYQAAGIKTTASPIMGKIRRVSLPPSQAWVMNLKPGEVSSVIADSNGYFIYKIKTKDTLPLDQAREEIIGILRSRRMQDEMRDIEKSATPTLNEVFFSPQQTTRGAIKPTGEPSEPSSKP
ncbi:MAG: peptidylprolyl isomerase, partial [Terriglobales bacterium]